MMTILSFSYLFICLAGIMFSLYLGIYLRRHLEVPGFGWASLVLFAFAEVIASFLVTSLTPSNHTDLLMLWTRLRFVGLGSLAPFFVLFILTYTDCPVRVRPRITVAIFVIPFIVQVIIWAFPDTFFAAIGYSTWQGLTIERVEFHGWFYLHLLYALVLVAAVAVPLMIANALWVVQQRPTTVYIMIAAIIFTISSVMTPLGIATTVNLAPIGGSIAATIIGYVLLRGHLYDAIPIAYDAIFQSMPDAVLIFNRSDELVHINAIGEALLEKPRAVLVGKRFTHLFPQQEDLFQRYKDVFELRTEVTAEHRTRLCAYDVHVTTLRRRGEAVGRMLVLRDISERKLAEQEREHFITELDAYAHTVAHDLKNPLALVMGYSELLAVSELASADSLLVNQITASSHKMKQIIDELLLMATVRELEQVNAAALVMGDIVQEALSRFQPQIAAKQAEVVVPSVWHPAKGYAPWVEEVWANYLSNALKYGGSPPRIELGSTRQANNMVRYWVHDNGTGIDPTLQSSLFSRIQPNAPLRHGHGLGLSIVRRIIERLGGEVGVQQAEGGGSIFYFTLPALHEPTLDVNITAPPPRRWDTDNGLSRNGSPALFATL